MEFRKQRGDVGHVTQRIAHAQEVELRRLERQALAQPGHRSDATGQRAGSEHSDARIYAGHRAGLADDL
jgi:hypothetical protein